MTNLTEAESLGKGNQSHQINGEIIIIPDEKNTFDGIWPNIEYQYGYGVHEKIDLRASFSSNLYLRVNGKFQFYNSISHDIAFGTSVETNLLSAQFLPTAHLYDTYSTEKYNWMINPSVLYSNLTAFTNSTGFAPFYSLSTGLGTKGKYRWKYGVNLGYAPKSDIPYFIGVGIGFQLVKNKL